MLLIIKNPSQDIKTEMAFLFGLYKQTNVS